MINKKELEDKLKSISKNADENGVLYISKKDFDEHILACGCSRISNKLLKKAKYSMEESLNRGGIFVVKNTKGEIVNSLFNDWYVLGKSIVFKKGKSYYKDGNRLGKRKSSLVLDYFESINKKNEIKNVSK